MLHKFFTFWTFVPLRLRFLITAFSGIAVMFMQDVFLTGITLQSFAFLIAGAIVVLCIGELIIQDVQKGISNIQDAINRLNALNLSTDTPLVGQVELQQIAKNLNTVVAEWRKVITTNLRSSKSMVEAVTVVEDQCTALQEMSDHQRTDITIMAENTVSSKQLVHEVEGNMERVNHSLHAIGDVITINSNHMQQLIQKTEEVASVSSVIRQISEQINLLALNAAIEAARAGDAGRGFAVVADEVRKLSNQSANAVNGIDEVVEALTRAVRTMEDGQSQIVSTIETIRANTSQVTDDMHTQAMATDDISSRVENFAGQIAEVHHNVEETSRVAIQLNTLAAELNDLASRFKL